MFRSLGCSVDIPLSTLKGHSTFYESDIRSELYAEPYVPT